MNKFILDTLLADVNFLEVVSGDKGDVCFVNTGMSCTAV